MTALRNQVSTEYLNLQVFQNRDNRLNEAFVSLMDGIFKEYGVDENMRSVCMGHLREMVGELADLNATLRRLARRVAEQSDPRSSFPS